MSQQNLWGPRGLQQGCHHLGLSAASSCFACDSEMRECKLHFLVIPNTTCPTTQCTGQEGNSSDGSLKTLHRDSVEGPRVLLASRRRAQIWESPQEALAFNSEIRFLQKRLGCGLYVGLNQHPGVSLGIYSHYSHNGNKQEGSLKYFGEGYVQTQTWWLTHLLKKST